ncbi:DUF6323 family protein [Clostridium sp. DJ247]|uniref:DUF6323 family protein n=1 Tax=Clostridium sp. DJ247 TaxID=2726188 RepID=UPI00162947C0|nr:DUF6323 family protein [Clostridium sp. DJ247]MBC2582093.1 hypothetical protein [Clostridium sp. DJ247]
MNLIDIFNSGEGSLNELYVNELLQTNEETKKYGLVLTFEDVLQIINVRNKVLKSYGRIELSFQVTKKFIEVFSSSAFINDKNYVRALNEMQEVFYYLKNETEDKLCDDELIELIKDLFENSCEGSVELLYGSLEEFSRNFRKKL